MRKICFAVFCLHVLIALAAPVGAQDRNNEKYVARMEQEHTGDRPVASPAAQAELGSEVVAKDAVYAEVEGRKIQGFVAHPASGVPSSGIVVIHEWWGLNDNVRAMTRRLAGEGHLALAVDLYEGQVAEDREAAARLARGSGERREQLLDNLGQAIADLERQGVTKIGVIGWCFGGGWSLRTALSFPDAIDAAVIYYGRLTTDPQELAALRAPVLGVFGALDNGIPVTTVREFQSALEALGKEASIHIYDGADHAFANPSGTRYNAAAAEDAWRKTVAFLAQNLQ
jgi:carboxymethylenebutenolidase